MSGDTDVDNKLSTDTITETSLDLSSGITEDDKILWRRDKNAVDFSLNYAKLWCKFCKEIVVALEKKSTLEIELCRSWSKQFQSFESTVSSSTMFGAPVRSEALMMSKLIIDQCKEIETQNTKKLGKLLDVINRQRTEFSKTRKHYKEKWKSDCKKMMDAENTMLKTKAAYYQRCQQGVKLREELTNAQALLTYMQDHGIQETGSSNITTNTNIMNQSSSATYNEGLGSVVTNQGSSTSTQNDPISTSQIIKQKLKVDKLEKQLADNDKKEIEQMYAYKESVENANNKLIEFEKKKMEHLCDIRLTTSRSDEIVKDTLAEYLRILAETRTIMLNEYATLSNRFQEYKPCHEYRSLIQKQFSNKPDVFSEKFQVELYHDCATTKEKSDSQVTKGLSRFGIGNTKETDHETNRNRSTLPSHSDSDSDTETTTTIDGSIASASNRSGVLNTIVEFGSNLFRQGGVGSIGNTSNEAIRRNQQIKNKKSTSGSTSSMTGSAEGLGEKEIEWQKEIENVIEIILKCVEVIELNGLSTHGIYRVSASKLKVGSVMESLNNQGTDVDLINEQPITLANVVKSKLISLSEPLVPYNLYNEFVDLGKEAEVGDIPELVIKLKALIMQLPQSNKKLAGLVFHHLKKVANNSEENQMGAVNLGTLFAPTLIKAKPRFRMADIKEYMDNKSQAKIVQIIIENVEILFGPEEQYYTSKLSKEDNFDLDEIRTSAQEDESNKSYLESVEENKIRQPRPHSSLIETNISLSSSSETSFMRPLSGSLRVPSPIPSIFPSSSNFLDRPAPKMMDMLLDKDTITSIRSVSPRSKKIVLEASMEKNQSVIDTSVKEKQSGSAPHRSISVGSGPLPESIKLAQLSKPSSDSIFSKNKDIEEKPSLTNFTTTSRYNDLKRSFIASTEISEASKNNHNSSSSIVDQNIKTTNTLISRSRPTSATTRSSYNYSSHFDSSVRRSCGYDEDYALQTNLSFDAIPKTCSSLNNDKYSCLTEISPNMRIRSVSNYYAVSPEPHNNLMNSSSSTSSPFVRQSKIRIPLSARSVTDLRIINKPVQNNLSNFYSSSLNVFLPRFASVDNLNSSINSQIAKYQSWLFQPIFDEFYV